MLRPLNPVSCLVLISTLMLPGCASQSVRPVSESVASLSADGSAYVATRQLTGTFADGVPWRYSGGVVNGRQHGEGEMVADNGWRFKGTWNNGQAVQGSMTYANGDVESGNFLDGQTTIKQAINGLESVRTYASGKMVKSESGGDLEHYMQAANYERAFALRGQNSLLGLEFQQNEATGVLEVVRLVGNAPADLAGIQPGDRILRYAGTDMKDKMQFLQAVVATAYATRVTIRVERAGQALDLALTPSIRPDAYQPGPGQVQTNSYEDLIAFYLTDLAEFDERIAGLDLSDKYKELAQQRKQAHVAGLKAGQACDLLEDTWIYKDDACKDGLAHGKGSAVHISSDLKFVGEFKQGARTRGLIIASGVEMYDGPVKDGRPEGEGICFHEGEPEECRFYRGKRVDAVYKQRIALAKQRKFMEEQQARQQAQIDSLRNDVKNTQFAIQQRSVPTSAGGLQQGMGDVLMDAAKRKAADKVMDAVFDKLF